jgi:hypothetical protein
MRGALGVCGEREQEMGVGVSRDVRHRRVEHWRGRLDVARPDSSKGSWRGVLLSLGAGLLAGGLVLAVLAVVALSTDHHGVLTWGVSVIIFVSFMLFVRFFVTPRYWRSSMSLDCDAGSPFDPEPQPLVTPALVVVGFAVPAIVFAVIDIVRVV